MTTKPQETTQHTPGPWMVCSGMVETVPTDAPNHARCGIPIAHMDRRPGNGTMPVERDANARLIAAAPRMLEVVRALTSIINAYEDDNSDSLTLADRVYTETGVTMIESARAILRDVEG